MNIERALTLARAKDLAAVRPWGTDITMLRLVEYFARRVHRTDSNGSYTLDVYSECKMAQDLNLNLRLVGGWRGETSASKKKKKGDDEEEEQFPPSVKAERLRGVPEFLLGFPVAQAPKLVRYIFFVDVKVNVWEFDLVAAHLRELLQLAIKNGIAHEMLLSYVKDEASVRSFRLEVASDHNLPATDIKRLMNMIGYGSSGASWVSDTGVEVPEQCQAVQLTAKLVCKKLWDGCTGRRKELCSQRARPALTNLSIECQLGERQSLDLLEQVVEQNVQNGAVSGFINDAILVHFMSSSEAQAVKAGLLQTDTLVSVTVLSKTTKDYKKFVESKLGKIDWTPLSEDLVQAELETMEFLAWLHPAPGVADPKRGGRPYLACARGVAPFLLYAQNRISKDVEWFDVDAGLWKNSGGEFMLTGDELNKVLCNKMVTFRMELRDDNGKKKMCPVKNAPHVLLKDPGCLSSVAGMLKTINKRFDKPLGQGCSTMLVFQGGTTVDFTLPFDQQVRLALPGDRNNRSSPWKFREPADEVGNRLRRQLGKDLSDFLNRLPNTADVTAEALVDKFGERFIGLMKGGHDPMLQHFYYEPAGGRLDSDDPKAGLGEALYSLRQAI